MFKFEGKKLTIDFNELEGAVKKGIHEGKKLTKKAAKKATEVATEVTEKAKVAYHEAKEDLGGPSEENLEDILNEFDKEDELRGEGGEDKADEANCADCAFCDCEDDCDCDCNMTGFETSDEEVKVNLTKITVEDHTIKVPVTEIGNLEVAVVLVELAAREAAAHRGEDLDEDFLVGYDVEILRTVETIYGTIQVTVPANQLNYVEALFISMLQDASPSFMARKIMAQALAGASVEELVCMARVFPKVDEIKAELEERGEDVTWL